MTLRSRSRPVHPRAPQLVRREMTCPGPDDAAPSVSLPGIALTGGSVTLCDGPRESRYALPLPLFVEPHGTHLRGTPRGHIEAGPCAGRNQLDAEINMVEICTNLPLDVEMTGSAPCSDTEQFSGYIITTGRSK